MNKIDIKVAVSFPTTYQLVEKVGVLFKEIDLIGFNGGYSNQESRYKREFDSLDIKVNLRRENYSEINPEDYDLLIDSYETRQYNPAWAKLALNWKIPKILKILFKNPEYVKFSDEEFSSFNKGVVSPETLFFAEKAEEKGFKHVFPLFYSPGPWWFENEWTGEVDKALFLIKVHSLRDTTTVGLSDWGKIAENLPDNTYHHNGSGQAFKTSKDLAEFCKKFRCYVNLDQGKNARPLCLVFTEMISTGIPPIVIKRPNTDYHHFIRNGESGFICEDLQEVISKIEVLIKDRALAESMSKKTRQIAYDNFSEEVLKPKWLEAINMAKDIV